MRGYTLERIAEQGALARRLLQAEANRTPPDVKLKQQAAHAARVEARQRQNNTPFADAAEQHLNGFAVGQ